MLKGRRRDRFGGGVSQLLLCFGKGGHPTVGTTSEPCNQLGVWHRATIPLGCDNASGDPDGEKRLRSK
jgi:hypothetical protein